MAQLRDLLVEGIRAIQPRPESAPRAKPQSVKVTRSTLARALHGRSAGCKSDRRKPSKTGSRTSGPRSPMFVKSSRLSNSGTTDASFESNTPRTGFRCPLGCSRGPFVFWRSRSLPTFQSSAALPVEEPENGVHPAALETIYQSLSSVYNAQVLVATSPVLLSMAKPEQILCFSKTPEGTAIIRGDEHPALRDWHGEASLGTMLASGSLS